MCSLDGAASISSPVSLVEVAFHKVLSLYFIVDNQAWLSRNDLLFSSVHRAFLHYYNNHKGAASQSEWQAQKEALKWIDPIWGWQSTSGPGLVISGNFVVIYRHMSLLNYWSMYHLILGGIWTTDPRICSHLLCHMSYHASVEQPLFFTSTILISSLALSPLCQGHHW